MNETIVRTQKHRYVRKLEEAVHDSSTAYTDEEEAFYDSGCVHYDCLPTVDIDVYLLEQIGREEGESAMQSAAERMKADAARLVDEYVKTYARKLRAEISEVPQ